MHSSMQTCVSILCIFRGTQIYLLATSLLIFAAFFKQTVLFISLECKNQQPILEMFTVCCYENYKLQPYMTL
jgi:hypothetical protein